MLLTCTRCLYIQTVTHCYAQSLHALKLLRCHGMSNDSLTHVYNVVVIYLHAIVRLTDVVGFYHRDRQATSRSNSVRRAIRLDDLMLSQLAADMDDNLFTNILNNHCYVLYELLPNNTEHTNHNLRPWRHTLSLTVETNCNNFINNLAFVSHARARAPAPPPPSREGEGRVCKIG